jgi:hypothetical protein
METMIADSDFVFMELAEFRSRVLGFTFLDYFW